MRSSSGSCSAQPSISVQDSAALGRLRRVEAEFSTDRVVHKDRPGVEVTFVGHGLRSDGWTQQANAWAPSERVMHGAAGDARGTAPRVIGTLPPDKQRALKGAGHFWCSLELRPQSEARKA